MVRGQRPVPVIAVGNRPGASRLSGALSRFGVAEDAPQDLS